jgi:lipoprotein NlpI/transglutaminase-like putative cysteine protease
MEFERHAAWRCGIHMALALCSGFFGMAAWAQTASVPSKPSPSITAKPPAKAPVSPAAAVAAARAGKGWRVGAIPAWAVEPPPPEAGLAAAPNAGSQRIELVDFQVNHALPKVQVFARIRSVALDPSAVGPVSQPQIVFNPAYQTVVIHSAAVVREGRRSERLAEARIEPMRREQRLEQQVIDGNDTLLVVLNDVKVGEPVEIVYTVEGDNPIFEGRITGGIALAYDAPVALLHQRWVVPAGRKLHTKGLATDAEAEHLTEGPNQVLRIVRHQVAAIAAEPQTPPWVKIYPAIQISEYGSWSEVDAWAQRLFALPQPMLPEVVAKAATFREGGLKGTALLSEVLRFVQDEVRYFSVSLGESSHRPKPPQATLADLMGDCKDKVQLLNALLRELGFDAKPALVSMQRNRGIRDNLPAPDIFDHVITRVDLDGRTWYLDATINGQGLTLESRGQIPYGSALVVGAGKELQTVSEASATANHMEFEQTWDLTQPGRPAKLVTVLRAHGYAAERWRASLARAGKEPLSQALTGGFARLLPGLKTVGEGEVNDDRIANRFEFRQGFEVPEFGQYNRGAIETEFLALDLLDVLTGPAETRRRMPYFVDQPQSVESRIVVNGPGPFNIGQQTPLEVVDRQFRYTARVEVQGNKASFVRRYERRDNQVMPAELASWREKILQARQTTAGRLRLPLLDSQALLPELQKVERRLRSARGWRDDNLHEILARNEFARVIDTHALARVPAGSALAARVLATRAQAHNLLADFAAARADAEQALAIKPEDPEALDALAVAQFGEGKAEQALATFARVSPQARSAAVTSWMGQVQLYLGRAAEAESLLREAVANGTGAEREFALIWLYFAAEQQGGRGQAVIAEHLEGTDAKKLTGAILRFLAGRLDRDALLRLASEQAKMERLNLAEAHFFIGQRLLVQGQRDEALRWFQRSVDTQATPYREVTFARMELQRAQLAGR